MKKKNTIILIILVLVVLLFPIKYTLKDGGSVCYKSQVYNIIQLHRMDDTYYSGYEEGLEIEIFGKTVYKRVISEIHEGETEEIVEEFSHKYICSNCGC